MEGDRKFCVLISKWFILTAVTCTTFQAKVYESVQKPFCFAVILLAPLISLALTGGTRCFRPPTADTLRGSFWQFVPLTPANLQWQALQGWRALIFHFGQTVASTPPPRLQVTASEEQVAEFVNKASRPEGRRSGCWDWHLLREKTKIKTK